MVGKCAARTIWPATQSSPEALTICPYPWPTKNEKQLGEISQPIAICDRRPIFSNICGCEISIINHFHTLHTWTHSRLMVHFSKKRTFAWNGFNVATFKLIPLWQLPFIRMFFTRQLTKGGYILWNNLTNNMGIYYGVPEWIHHKSHCCIV
jgi:hypothetical protein